MKPADQLYAELIDQGILFEELEQAEERLHELVEAGVLFYDPMQGSWHPTGGIDYFKCPLYGAREAAEMFFPGAHGYVLVRRGRGDERGEVVVLIDDTPPLRCKRVQLDPAVSSVWWSEAEKTDA